MDDSEKIKKLVEIVDGLASAQEKLAQFLKRETQDRVKTCLAICESLVVLKNHHAMLVRKITKSAALSDAGLDLSHDLTTLDRECERLEYLICEWKKIYPPEPPEK